MSAAAGTYNRAVTSAGQGCEVFGWEPGSPLVGQLRVPGSKSLALRAITAALLAEGRTRLGGLPAGQDVEAGRRFAASSGALVRSAGGPGALIIEGRPPAGRRGGPHPDGPVDVGESGTLARFATAVLGLCAPPGTRPRVVGRGSLARRGSAPLFAALRAAGVSMETQGEPVGWPVTLRPLGPPPEIELVAPVSSQEASALALALAAYPGGHTLIVRGELPSPPYFRMTLAVLADFGVRVESEGGPGGARRWHIAGPMRAPAEPWILEPDASSAAVALAAGCLSGGEVLALGLGPSSRQGDVRIAEHLAAFGCRTRFETEGLLAGGFPLRPVQLDLTGEPDLAPVLAAVGAGLALARPDLRPTTLTGLETLARKESDRIAVLAAGFEGLGLRVERGPGHLSLAGRPEASTARDLRVLDSAGDHRMAFAFALIGLVRPGVRVQDPGVVAKTWPHFWRDLSRLGAQVPSSLRRGPDGADSFPGPQGE